MAFSLGGVPSASLGGGMAAGGGGLGFLGNLGGLFSGGGFQNIANPTPLQMGTQINKFMDAQKMQQMFSGLGGLGGDGTGLMNMGYKLLAANRPTTNPYQSGFRGLMGDMDMSDLINLKKAEEVPQTGQTQLVEIQKDPIENLPTYITPQVENNPNMLEEIMKAKSPMYQSEVDRGWGYRGDADNINLPMPSHMNLHPMFDTQNPYYSMYGRYGGGY